LVYESAYGISPDSEPSAQDFAKIIKQIKKEKIKKIEQLDDKYFFNNNLEKYEVNLDYI
jgi:ABC-type Zn uptake system ZnuABC Zn-binding protein ZnuA